jgi:hypothetical protein
MATKSSRGAKIRLATALPIAFIRHRWRVGERHARRLLEARTPTAPDWGVVLAMLTAMELVLREECDESRALALFCEALESTPQPYAPVDGEDLEFSEEDLAAMENDIAEFEAELLE